jgi:hypothetical protein
VLWLGAEERLVLDGDRERLREIRRAAEGVMRAAGAAAEEAGGGGRAGEGAAEVAGAGCGGAALHARAAEAVLEDAATARLRRERRALVESDAGYTASHPLVRKIDAALAERRRQARAAPEAAGGTRGAE